MAQLSPKERQEQLDLASKLWENIQGREQLMRRQQEYLTAVQRMNDEWAVSMGIPQADKTTQLGYALRGPHSVKVGQPPEGYNLNQWGAYMPKGVPEEEVASMRTMYGRPDLRQTQIALNLDAPGPSGGVNPGTVQHEYRHAGFEALRNMRGMDSKPEFPGYQEQVAEEVMTRLYDALSSADKPKNFTAQWFIERYHPSLLMPYGKPGDKGTWDTFLEHNKDRVDKFEREAEALIPFVERMERQSGGKSFD